MLDVAIIKDYLTTFKDTLSTQFPNYEQRIEQDQMVSVILNGIYKDVHVLVEAGTGTGKSLAYLLAFLSLSAASGGRSKVVISTHTINLQEQLLNKDIPLLQSLLGSELSFKAALAKGRSNYVCKRRLKELLINETSGFSSLDDAKDFAELRPLLIDESGRFLIGDRSDLAINVSSTLWDTFNASNDICLEARCPMFKECFFREAREQLKEADLIVSNHALFFADLSIRGSSDGSDGILPAYDYVVFDEAHHLEDVACGALSTSVDGYRLRTIGGRLRSLLNKGTLKNYLVNEPLLHEQIEATMRSYFNQIDRFLLQLQLAGNGLSTRRLRFERNGTLPNPLSDDIKEVLHYLEQFSEHELLGEEMSAEIDKAKARWKALQTDLEFCCALDGEQHVYWIESRTSDWQSVTLTAAPISMAEKLREALFSKPARVVLTSATLASPDLGFMASRLGIDEHLGKVLSSPFDHQTNALLYVPEQAMEPSYNNNSAYEAYVADLIRNTVALVRGGAFVLFTSYQMLNSIYDEVADELRLLGLQVLRQGDLPRHELLRQYVEAGNAVLFGTSSFWEGVDVAGEALRCVIITKLPFSVPDHPVTEARMEALEAEGLNPFREYQLPQAVLRLKQGYGRLIRTAQDRGIVVIADGRVRTRSYGRVFLGALPTGNVTDNWDAVKRFVESQKLVE